MTIWTRPYADLSALERAAWHNDTNGEYAASNQLMEQLPVSDQMTVETDAAAYPEVTRKSLDEAHERFAAMVAGEDSFDDLYNPF